MPIIDCTDLYRPFQDCANNIDIPATPYSLPEIDLRLEQLDNTDNGRNAIVIPKDPALKD